MKYPKINKQPTRTVQIPSLSGGMNLRDSLNLCNDNQLTDSLNMWFRDGVLKTRDGLNQKDIRIYENNKVIEKEIPTIEVKIHKDIRFLENGETYIFTSIKTVYSESKKTILYFGWFNGNNCPEKLSSLEFDSLTSSTFNYFLCCHNKVIYCYVNDSAYKVYKSENKGQDWIEVPEEKRYAPIVITNCVTTATSAGPKDFYAADLLANGGVMYEGYNLLTRYYRMVYSTVNPDLDFNAMSYTLLFNPSEVMAKYPNEEIKVIAKITDENGITTEHTVVIEGADSREDTSKATKDNKYMRVLGKYVQFYSDSKYENMIELSTVGESAYRDVYIENNLEIIAPSAGFTEKELNKIFNMTQAEWFGGASEGINGGTRLFLGGNIEEKEQSLIIWSGLNNPLYFSENNYSYVGNSMSAVTAFGKQSDMLVIFKENELYYTKYTQNTNITAEDLINQSVVDYQASNVYFPLVQIHSGIGCDCPNTVQLCRNRLVWADSRGYVYTLTNNNQFSERNIFCVSDMVHNKLSTETDLRSAYSADYGDYYMLFCGNKVYLMDYNSYGYQYISSFSKAEDANIRIPWYYWEVNGSNNSLYISVDKKLLCFNFEYTTDNRRIELYVFDSETDNGQPIKSMAQTKFFDFGLINYKKNIDNVTVSFGNNGGTPIMLQYLTERGTDAQTVTVTDDETNIRNAGYITTCILRPAIKSIERFGLRFNCDGNMAIQGLNISYRALGGIK